MSGYFRFRRTVRIAPGVRLNVSKSGLSTSFGPRGFHYTIGHGRHRTTVGIPGTGLSYTTFSSAHAAASSRPPARARRATQQQLNGATTAPGGGTSPTASSSLAQLASMLPSQKIAWGILFTLLVITAPVGLPLLVSGLWQLHVPVWRIRMYVHQAAKEPANAAELLGMAAAIDPHSPEVLGPLAELRAAHGDNAAALGLYSEYCAKVPADWLARGHLALAAIRCNHIDEAIANLVAIRQNAPLTGDSLASVVAHLAYAYLCKEDPDQALALIDEAATHAAAGAPGAQQCLFYQGVSEYMLGRTSVAVRTLDRLYAINPAYEGLQAAKDAMAAGTYELLLPDGSALVPVSPGQIARTAVKVQRAAPRSRHCSECQAPLAPGAVVCPYCHTAVAEAARVEPPPPPPA